MMDTKIEADTRHEHVRGERWFAIRTFTGREQEAIGELSILRGDAWCPIKRTLTKPTKKRKPVPVERAAMPGYVLAQVGPDEWQDVLACRGVIGWVAGPDGPLVVPRQSERQIALMRERERVGDFDDDGIDGRLMPGDMLEVLFGPLSGWMVAFIGVSGRKLIGEVEMLGAKRRVRVNLDHVKLSN